MLYYLSSFPCFTYISSFPGFTSCLKDMFYPFCGGRYQAAAYIEASAFIYQDGKVRLFSYCIIFGWEDAHFLNKIKHTYCTKSEHAFFYDFVKL